MSKKAAAIASYLLLTTVFVRAQDTTFYHHSLSVNPIKKVMGLINIEYEYALNKQWAVKSFGEWMIGDALWLSGQAHPKGVGNAGVRYYWRASDEQSQMKGVVTGLKLPQGGEDSMSLGFEVGYRMSIKNRWFVSPTMLLNYVVSDADILFGIEVRLGGVF